MTVNTGRFLIHSERTEGPWTQKDLSVLMQVEAMWKSFGTFSEICQSDSCRRYQSLNPEGTADNLAASPHMEKYSDIILAFCVIIQRSISADDSCPVKSGLLHCLN